VGEDFRHELEQFGIDRRDSQSITLLNCFDPLNRITIYVRVPQRPLSSELAR